MTDGNIKFRGRIAAMDASEKGQPYAKVARYRLDRMLSGQNSAIISIGKGVDRYGRVLGQVSVNGKDIAREHIIFMISDTARDQIDILERLADKNFLKPPDNQRNSLDTWWNRLLRNQSWEDARHAFEGKNAVNSERDG